MDIEELKEILDEAQYPYYTDEELEKKLVLINANTNKRHKIIRDMLLAKASIPAIKLGDVEIPSPANYFIIKSQNYRKSMTGTAVRADGR